MRIFCMACLLFATSAQAAFLDEIQVYDSEINEVGEFGLEVHVNTTLIGDKTPAFNQERVSAGGVRLTPEFSYGLTKEIELGFYLPTVYTPGYGYESAGYKSRIKWMPLLTDGEQPWSAGVNFEYSNLNTGMELAHKNFEARTILAWDKDRWSVAVNPIFDFSVSDGQDRTADFNMGLRAMYALNGPLSGVGLEYYEDFGAINQLATPPAMQAKQIFAIAEMKSLSGLFKGIDLHMGLGYGWDSANTLTLKMILTPKF